MSITTAVKLLFLLALTLLGLGLWMGDPLPAALQVNPQTFAEPIQSSSQKKAFKTKVEGIEYTIKPMADYDIAGVVVSRHDSAVWWDWIHAASNDHLNVADLCVVWGANVKSNNYQQLRYASGQFECFVKTNSNEVWGAFEQNALSNNHVLTDDKALAKKIRSIKVGDQIRLKGSLAEYSHSAGMNFRRGTSLVRTDRGNGACETLFVDSVEIIKPAARMPVVLRWLGLLLILLSAWAWVFWTPVITEG